MFVIVFMGLVPFIADSPQRFSVQVYSAQALYSRFGFVHPDLPAARLPREAPLLVFQPFDALSETHSAASRSPLHSARCTLFLARHGPRDRGLLFPLLRPPNRTAGYPRGQDRACNGRSLAEAKESLRSPCPWAERSP